LNYTRNRRSIAVAGIMVLSATCATVARPDFPGSLPDRYL